MTLDFARLGKPTTKAFIESLNANWFRTLQEAPQEFEAWRRDYNESLPTERLATKRLWNSIGRRAPPASKPANESRISQQSWSKVVGKLNLSGGLCQITGGNPKFQVKHFLALHRSYGRFPSECGATVTARSSSDDLFLAAAPCCCCGENPLRPPIQISRTCYSSRYFD